MPRVQGGAMVVPADETSPVETRSSTLPQSSDAPNVDVDMGDNELPAQEEHGNDMAMGFIGSLEPTADDVISEMILMALGSSGKSYRRETRGACQRLAKVTVSEMYSPPRVTAELRQSQRHYKHLMLGFAMDLAVNDPDNGQPWDFPKVARGRRHSREFERRGRT